MIVVDNFGTGSHTRIWFVYGKVHCTTLHTTGCGVAWCIKSCVVCCNVMVVTSRTQGTSMYCSVVLWSTINGIILYKMVWMYWGVGFRLNDH